MEGEAVFCHQPELPLPSGVPLTTVAGIELHPQDVGHALQFVQFCVAFEWLEAKALKSKLKAPDCIRTEPYLFDENGRAFWRLTGYDAGNDMFLQDVGTWDPFTSSDEKWWLYGEEKKEAVEKYCSSVRKLMNENLSQTLPSSSGSKDEEMLESASTGSEEEGIAKSTAEE